MINGVNQSTKAKQFYKLHHSGKMLVFPNVWDSLGAHLLESLGYPAIATASAAIALSNGYLDGEIIPFAKVVPILRSIVESVEIPVSADIECGYYLNNEQFENNITQLLNTGIVGLNIEDFDSHSGLLLSIEEQSERISIIRKVADKIGVPVFINARVDIYIHGDEFTTPEEKFAETVKRGLAYKMVGADCIFPIGIRQKDAIEKLISELKMPINILALPNIPDLKTLAEIGVARVSLGPGFLKIAMKAMKDLASKLKNQEGLNEVLENEVTSDYLKKLVSKEY
ncbi:MAG: isocitrate lyase/phosphoenolpyruvate mutase family protein [Chitinophagaceae bacterium]